MMSITTPTLPEAWYKAVRHIMEFGNVVDTEYGLKARQILMGTIEIDKPSFGWHKGDRFVQKHEWKSTRSSSIAPTCISTTLSTLI